MQRRGLTIGSGRKGYYNVVGKDPQVHRQSAMGIKQPQRVITLSDRFGQGHVAYYPSRSQNPSKTAIQIGNVKDYSDRQRYKVYESGNRIVIGGGKTKFNPSMLTDVDAALFKYHKLKDKSRLTPSEKRDLARLENKLEKVQVSRQFKNYLKQHKIAIISAAAGAGLCAINAITPPQSQDNFSAAMLVAYPLGYMAYETSMIRQMESHEFDRLDKRLPDVPREQKEQIAIRMVRKKLYGGKGSQKENCPQVFVYHKGEVYRVKGGKLPFGRQGIEVYELPEENAIYVPSTNSSQTEISDSEMQQRKVDTEDFLSKLYGGYTRFEDSGGYYDKDLKKVIKEKGVKVVSFSTKDDALDKQKSRELKKWIVGKQKEWGQQTIGYENEGDLYYINSRKIKPKKGFTPISSVP